VVKKTLSLPLSALLFFLAGLELSATIKKSTEEGQIAFLGSRIQSSEQRALAERLRSLLKARDVRSLRLLLVEAGIIGKSEIGLENLETLESSLARDFERQYSLILYYLPDDLKQFFGKRRILWDVKNLKMLLCHVSDQVNSENCMHLVGPFGYLDSASIESLARSKSLEELVENSGKTLPLEFSSKIRLEQFSSENYLEFSLDLAAFEFLKESSEEIGTRRARLVWDFMTEFYEVQNLLAIGRLKQSKTRAEEIRPFLFPCQSKLDKSDVGRLLECEDYPAFLRVLRDTYYRKWLPEGMLAPSILEAALRRAISDLDLGETQPEMARIVQFVVGLETDYDTIRKAAFLTSVRAYNEE
jgi:vacuolar-type H+-ATPase subunit C/Vma6